MAKVLLDTAKTCQYLKKNVKFLHICIYFCNFARILIARMRFISIRITKL